MGVTIRAHVDGNGQGSEFAILVLGPGKLMSLKDTQVQMPVRQLRGELFPVLLAEDLVIEAGLGLDEILHGFQGRLVLVARLIQGKAAAGADTEEVSFLGLLSGR